MLETLKWQPDFPAIAARFEAWWHGEVIDRPPVSLNLAVQREYRGPVCRHKSLRDKWLDVRFRVDQATARLAQQDFAGDALPVLMPNLGPQLAATLYGGDLRWSDDPHSSQTNWAVPVVHDPHVDWPRIAATPPCFDPNPYWQALEAMTRLALEQCDGRYLVGHTDIHDAYDTLAALRGPQGLCLDMIDCPHVVQPAALHAAQGVLEMYQRLWRLIHEAGQGWTSWIPAWHDGFTSISCCDFWAMLSPRLARDYVLPAVRRMIDPFERSIFHLDGPAALKHLDLLLAIPNLHAVQWVYGDGHEPATRWIDVYRRIQAAGKSSQIYVDTPQQSLDILQALGSPRGLWFCVGRPFDTRASADAFLRDIAALAARQAAAA